MVTVRLSVLVYSQLVCWHAATVVYEFAYVRNREGLSVRITSLSDGEGNVWDLLNASHENVSA